MTTVVWTAQTPVQRIIDFGWFDNEIANEYIFPWTPCEFFD